MAESTRDVFDALLTDWYALTYWAEMTFGKQERDLPAERARWIERWERAEGKHQEWIDTRHNPSWIMRDKERVGTLADDGTRTYD